MNNLNRKSIIFNWFYNNSFGSLLNKYFRTIFVTLKIVILFGKIVAISPYSNKNSYSNIEEFKTLSSFYVCFIWQFLIIYSIANYAYYCIEIILKRAVYIIYNVRYCLQLFDVINACIIVIIMHLKNTKIHTIHRKFRIVDTYLTYYKINTFSFELFVHSLKYVLSLFIIHAINYNINSILIIKEVIMTQFITIGTIVYLHVYVCILNNFLKVLYKKIIEIDTVNSYTSFNLKFIKSIFKIILEIENCYSLISNVFNIIFIQLLCYNFSVSVVVLENIFLFYINEEISRTNIHELCGLYILDIYNIAIFLYLIYSFHQCNMRVSNTEFRKYAD